MKIRRPEIKPCPWFSRDDMLKVSRLLFNGGWQEENEALEEMLAWSARSWPFVPLGVEVTVGLIKAFRLAEKPERNIKEVELISSMSLVRFVNLVTEVGQVFNNRVSMNSIARKMDVPEWIIELRNLATHSILPSLSILKTGIIKALKWMKENYWKDKEALSDFSMEPLEAGLETTYGYLLLLQSKLIKVSQEQGEYHFKGKVRMKFVDKSSTITNVLVNTGLLWPTTHQMLKGNLGGTDDLINYKLELWNPVVELLHKDDRLLDFIEPLLVEAFLRPRMKGRIAAKFISVFLRKLESKDISKNKQMYKRLYMKFIKMKYSHLKMVIEFFPKSKREDLLRLAARRSACNNKPVRTTSDDVNTEAIQEIDTKFIACPVGMLPDSFGAQQLNFKLPDHVDMQGDVPDFYSPSFECDEIEHFQQTKLIPQRKDIPYLL